MKVNIKTNYNEITVEDYIKLVSISASTTDVLDREIEVLSVLTDKTQEELLTLPIQHINRLVGKTSFLSEEPIGVIKKEYTLGGRTFRPNLEIYKYSAGRFIDLVEMTKDKSRALDNLHLVTAILLDPIEKTVWYKKDKVLSYNEVSVTDTAELVYKEMSITDSIALVNFFYHLLLVSSEITKPYSPQSQVKSPKK